MGFTDTVMAGRLGTVDLAAVAIGSTLWIPIYLACVGVMMALSPSVAHHQGAGRRTAIGVLYRQSLWLSGALALLAFATTSHIGAVMYWIGVDRAVVPVTEEYLDAIAWGMPAACFYMGLRFVSEGIGHTRPVMYIQLLGLLVNVLGNYVFMYGALGNPPLGAVGAGWSSALVLTLTAVAMMVYVVTRPRYRPYRLFARLERPRRAELVSLLRLGLPIALVTLMEVGLFTAIGLLMGSLGATAIAAHQIAVNYAALMFMFPLGISMATTVRVGQAIGANGRREARIAGFLGMGMATGAMLVSAVFMLSVPNMIVGMYTEDQSVASLAKNLLLMAAMFQLSDGLQAGALGALRGFKDTRYPVLVTFFAYWVAGLPLAWFLGIGLSIGPRGLWVGLVAGLTLAAILLSVRFYRVSHPLRDMHDYTHDE
jgi:MATE family multidrug resistance protein